MSGLKSKRKGFRYENAQRIACNAFGPCSRMPLSGALGGEWSGDLKWLVNNIQLKCQCKIKAGAYKTDYAELADHDVLFKRADHKPTLVVMEFAKFCQLIEPSEREAFLGDVLGFPHGYHKP